MSTLIVFLSPPGAPPAADYRYALTLDGHAVTDHGSVPLALLPHTGRTGGDVVAVVPARALSWHRVTLPKGTGANSPRLRAVLEGLLEERLLDDPAALHFALEPGHRPGQPVWVAACNRAWLQASVLTLESANRPVARIVPEFAPPDAVAGDGTPLTLHAIGTPDDAQWVAVGYGADRSVAVFPLSAATLALVQLPADGDTPVLAEPAVAAQAEGLLGRPVTLQTSAQRWLASARNGWDLAQFDLASSGRTRAFKKAGTLGTSLLRAPQWRAARWGAAALVLVNLVGLNAWAWREKSALQDKQTSVRGLLTQTFPGVQVVVDAPLQMEREVALLRQSAGGVSGRDLESILASLSAAAPAGKAATAIEFIAGEAHIKGLALSAEEAAGLATRLKTQGYAARTDGDTLLVRLEVAP